MRGVSPPLACHQILARTYVHVYIASADGGTRLHTKPVLLTDPAVFQVMFPDNLGARCWLDLHPASEGKEGRQPLPFAAQSC